MVASVLLLLQVAAPASGDSGVIYAELKNDLKYAHAGQQVRMVALQDTRAEDGTVLIPSGAKLSGKVTFVQKHKKSEPAILAFVLEQATWKGGSLDFKASIQKLELMKDVANAPSGGPSGLGRGYGMSSSGSNDPKYPPPDCNVDTTATNGGGASVVCRERDVDMGPGGRVYLVIAPRAK